MTSRATRRVLIATDLDRTLIYSASAAEVPLGRRARDLVAVEHLDGRPISFMSTRGARMLADLSRRHVVVPVTTRTPEQLERVRLPGAAPRYAVAANGGVLLVEGLPDAEWAETVRTAIGAVAPLDVAVAMLAAECRGGWATPPRSAAGLFCYVVLDRAAMPEGVLQRLVASAGPAGWRVSLQGRKLYLVPTPLTKSAALLEVARRTGTGLTLAAGDSLLDIDLLVAADEGVHPGHGEIAVSGWSVPWVTRLPTTGVRAGEEILDWLASRADRHVSHSVR